ncbi:hypothetical protein NGM10_05585 [Halorussus salilacus]|uniref:hypothetical protein n=1 Tax=Halorussus salilacus TaxID=2953750 RepID=UPI00209D6BC7|nr:hypothetical protein [Halorussus salilacus]USZ69211.1 hypothetical protein NGM10_05585 [Halorussus salilacus]
MGGDYTHTVSDYHIELDGGYGTGEKNNDVVTLSWKSEDYDLPEDGTFTEDATNVHLVQSSFNGAMWSYSDWDACGYGCDGASFAVGVRAKRETEDTPRKIQATYQSVWNDDTTVSGMTVNSGGDVELNFEGSSTEYVEQINRQVREESFETDL